MTERRICCGGVEGRNSLGCGAPLSWEREGGEWRPDREHSRVAIRCLDCGTLLCGHCAREHFKGDEKDKKIRELNHLLDQAHDALGRTP